MFKLCILEAGYINPALKDKYPPYSDLFKNFLKYKTRNWNVSSYRLYKSEFPNSSYSPDNGASKPILRILFSSLLKRLELKNNII